MADESRLPKKKVYGSPTVTVISLRPEEAVLGNCKAANGGGPGGVNNCRHAGNCMNLGS
jgi:hypothetical protein